MKVAFEQQRIPKSKKTKKWAQNTVDAICARADEYGPDWYRMQRNYRLKNNQIDQKEYREYCDTLGLDKGEGNKFVEPLNKTPAVIDVLKGEENSMPWNYGVINLSPQATNEVLREKQRLFRIAVDEKLSLEIDKQNEIVAMLSDKEAQSISQGGDQQQIQQQLQQINEKYQKKFDNILSMQQIEDKFKNYKSTKEVTMNKLLKAVVIKNNIKWIKNQTFEDVPIAGIEIVEVCNEPHSGMPYIKQINPLEAFYHKSSDEPFIQYSQFAGYRENSTLSDVLDKYGEYLDDEQVKKLRTFQGAVYGTDASFYSEDSPSHWDEMKKYEYMQDPFSVTPSIGSGNIRSEGLYATDRWRRRNEGHAIVYHVYWASYRKIGVVTFIDEMGEEGQTFVGEEFQVPADAKKSKKKTNKYTGDVEVFYEWEDLDKNPVKLKWIWIKEVWKGIRINGDIHVYARPVEDAYQSLENPYKTKLPIHGFIYNNRNALSLSIMDRMEPWQRLYFIVAAKWLKLISQDKGVVSLLNVLMMDKDLGLKNSLAMAVDQGFLPYNPLAHNQNIGQLNNMKAAEILNLSNSQQLSYYTELLSFIERQIKTAAGISEQRLAQTSRSSNVTDNQRDMAQSMNITNALFSAHELLWQEILQSLCERIVKAVNKKSNIVRQILSDDEIGLLDLGMLSMEDEYSVRVGNNMKSAQLLQEMKGMSQALLQNDKASFSTLLDMYHTENLPEFREQLKAMEAELDRRQQQAQQSQQQMQEEAMKSQKEMENVKMAHEKELAKIKGDYDIKKAQIAAMAWSEDKDVDKDGLPDVMEIQKYQDEVRNTNTQLSQAERKLDIEQQKLDLERRKAGDDRGKQARDAMAKQRDLDLKKEQIQNQKIKAKSN